MNSRRGHGQGPNVRSVLAILAAGVFIIAVTAYAIITLTTPPTPERDAVSAPQDNTPYPGKKW